MKDYVQDIMADRLMSVPEVVKRLHVSRGIVLRILNAGLLPFIQINRSKKISVSSFNRFIADLSANGSNLIDEIDRAERKIILAGRRDVIL